jgi:hypothetical protein
MPYARARKASTAKRRTSWKDSLRPAIALYALAFLIAASAAPHRHRDSFEDLLFDGPSDSGTCVVDTLAGESGGRESVGAAIDDDPCLACFHHDYAAAVAALIVFRETFAPVPLKTGLPGLNHPDPVPDSAAARSPPDRA